MATIRGFSLAKLTTIRVTFAAFDSRAASAREFLRRVSSTRLKVTNPKCKIQCTITGDYCSPSVDVTLSDGSTLQFDAANTKVLDMIAQINLKSKTL